jgi:hypothetical protein
MAWLSGVVKWLAPIAAVAAIVAFIATRGQSTPTGYGRSSIR